MICSGKTSNLFFTPSRSSTVFDMVLMSVILGDTSCAMSLSPVEISTLRSCFAAAQASVPMTSSASTPGLAQDGQPMPFTASNSGSICDAGRRASAAMRLVLGEQLVAEGLARRVEYHGDALGLVVLEELVSMLSTPNTAPVGSPRELLNGGSAWKARYRYDEPSTRTRSGGCSSTSALAASCFFFSSRSAGDGNLSGAGEAWFSGESAVCGEFGDSVVRRRGGGGARRLRRRVTICPASRVDRGSLLAAAGQRRRQRDAKYRPRHVHEILSSGLNAIPPRPR
jgi:hypothetical protein